MAVGQSVDELADRPLSLASQLPHEADAERPKRHSHAERGNDQPRDSGAFCLERGTHSPQFREQHRVEHLAQVTHALRATGAGLETDDALHRGHMPKAPLAE